MALLRRVVEVPKPVVARVDGHVRAGGLGLLGACDVVVVSERSDFALTECGWARPGGRLAHPAAAPRPRAGDARYYLTGERFGAAEAVRIGLATAAAEDADDERSGRCSTPCGGPRPRALRRRRPWWRLGCWQPSSATRTLSCGAPQSLFASAEAREGMTAFLERRDPHG